MNIGSLDSSISAACNALVNQAKSAQSELGEVFKNIKNAESGLRNAVKSGSPEQMFNAQQNFQKANQAFEMVMAIKNAINKMINEIIDNIKRIGQ